MAAGALALASPAHSQADGLGPLARARGITFGSVVQGELLATDPLYAGAYLTEAQALVSEALK